MSVIEGSAVGPVAEHRVHGVSRRDDAGDEGDRRPSEPRGVARPIDALVVVEDPWGELKERRVALKDLKPKLRVALHLLVLIYAEGAGFAEGRVRDADLADVVEGPRLSDMFDVGAREAEGLCDELRELAHACVVRGRIWVHDAKGPPERLYERAPVVEPSRVVLNMCYVG